MTFGKSWRYCNTVSSFTKRRHVRIKGLDDGLDPIYRLGRHDVRLVEQDHVGKLDLIRQSTRQSCLNENGKRYTGR